MPSERQAGHKGHGRKRVQKPGQVNALAAKYLKSIGHRAWVMEVEVRGQRTAVQGSKFQVPSSKLGQVMG
jgi:hypothetical protein